MVRTGGLQNSAFEVPLTVEAVTITANNKILTDDITIDADFVNGDSGRIRFLFSFTTAAAADYQITLTKLGAADLTGFPLKLNADNTFILLSDGYYQFDISVRPGELINFSSNVDITKINNIQVQKIQIAT